MPSIFTADGAMGSLPWRSLISRLLSRHEFGLYASPDYLAKHGTPLKLNDLSAHRGIAFRQNKWRLGNGKTWQTVAFAHQVACNNLGMGLRLAVNAVGIALLPDIAVKKAVAQGGLQRVLPDWHGEEVSTYAITATKLIPQKTQVLIDFLKEKLVE